MFPSWWRKIFTRKPHHNLKSRRSSFGCGFTSPDLEVLEDRTVPSGLVYRTSIDPGPNPFEVYNTATNSWGSLGTLSTSANLAVSQSGDLYALNDTTNMIQQYNPALNTWTDVQTGPPTTVTYGNLEITNSEEFFVTQSSRSGGDASKMYYTTGANWNVFTLPGNAGPIGDYDPATNTIAVSQENSETVWTIDPETLGITTFSAGASSTSETRRFGEIYNGFYYTQWSTTPIRRYDLSDNSSPIENASSASPGNFVSAAVDPATGIFYTNTFGSTTFQSWDSQTDSFTTLPSAPMNIGHNTLAFVSSTSLDFGDAPARIPGADQDGDGVLDTADNSPFVVNADQADTDGDGTGDPSDPAPNNASITGNAYNYPTVLAQDGPRHTITGLRFGATVDDETDGQPNITASGDGSDEDGVTFMTSLVAGSTATIGVNVQGATAAGAKLDAWIDWNQDGDWNDAGEQVAISTTVFNGNNTLSVAVPATATVSAPTVSYARFRLSTAGGLATTGAAPDGEVEDYQVTLEPFALVGVAVDAGNHRLVIFNPTTGTQTTVVNIPTSGNILDTVISPDGKLAYISNYSYSRIWVADLTTASLAGGPNPINVSTYAEDLALTADGKYLLAADAGGPVVVVDTTTGLQVFATNTPAGAAHAVAVSGSDVLISTYQNYTFHYTLNPDTGMLTWTGQVSNVGGFNVTIAPNGTTALVQRDYGNVTSVFVDGMTPVSSTANLGGIVSTAFSPDGSRFYVRTSNGAAGYNYDPATGTIGAQFFNVGGLSSAPNYFGVDQLDVTAERVYTQSGSAIVALDAMTGAFLGSIPLSGAYFVGVDIFSDSIQDDFGDAPATYGTAQHLASGVQLGADRDSEAASQVSADASGDDTSGEDDEDGVTISPLAPGGFAQATATISGSSGNARLYGWIDFNGDGDFADPGEEIADGTGSFADLDDGTVNVSFAGPATGFTGTTFARFRVSTDMGLSFDGAASDGEVEDYALSISSPSTVYVDPAFTGAPGSDPDGAGPATAIGYDAFATIQQGADVVSAGGTVVIDSATYAEDVQIHHAATLEATAGTVTVDSLASDNGVAVGLAGEFATASGGSFTFGGPVTLEADTTLTTDGSGDVEFDDAVDGGFALAVNSAGITTFGGPVGASTPLATLVTDTAGSTVLTDGNITTTGNLFLEDDVTLAAGTVLTTTGSGDVLFVNLINGSYSMTIDAAGAVVLGNNVGNAQPLTSLLVSAAQDISLSGNPTVTTTGDQTYNAPVSAALPTLISQTGTVTFNDTVTVIQSLAVTADEIDFNGTVSPTSGIDSTLTLAPASAELDIDISGPGGTAALDLTATEIAEIQSGFTSVTIGRSDGTGTITVGSMNNVVAPNSTTFLTGGSIAIGDNQLSVSGSLKLTADADANGTGAISTGTGTVSSSGLTALAAQGIALHVAGGPVSATNSTSGDIVLDAPNNLFLAGVRTLGGNGNIQATANGDIILTGPVSADGSGDITLEAGNKVRVFSGTDTLTSGSGNIQVTGELAVEVAGVTTTGTYEVNADSNADGVGTYTQYGSATASSATISAANVDLHGALDVGSGSVLIQPSMAGTEINLGTDTSGSLSLTDAELDRVTAASLAIGNTSSGNIQVSAPISPAMTDTLVLTTGAAIEDINSTEPDISVANLVASAVTGITLDTSVDTLDATATPAGNIHIAEADNLTVLNLDAGTGTITLAGGTFTLGDNNAIARTSAVVVDAGATLDLDGHADTIGSLAGAGTVILGTSMPGSGVLVTGGDHTSTTFSGVISGTGQVSKVGSGTFTLSGPNSYTGYTNIFEGTLQEGANDALSDSTTVYINTGATFDLDGHSDTIGALFGSGDVTLGSGTLTTGGNDTSTSFSGSISGSGGLTKVGSGTFTLSGNSSYTGSTSIDEGTLALTGSLTGGPTADVVLAAPGVTLDGGGSGVIGDRRVVVASGVTGALVEGLAGLTNPASVGLLVSPGASVRVLNNTISGNHIGVEVDSGTALLEGNDLSNNTVGSGAAGLQVENGAIVDAGQTTAAQSYYGNITGLGISTGGNTFLGYTAAYAGGPQDPATAPQAIRNLNSGGVYGNAGPQLGSNDLPAQNNDFGVSTFSAIENLVYHDLDNSALGFVVVGGASGVLPHVVAPIHYYASDPAEGTATTGQKSVIRHIQVTFDSFVFFAGQAATLTKVNGPDGAAAGTMVTLTADAAVYDPVSGTYTVSYSVSGPATEYGSVQDGNYTFHLVADNIQGGGPGGATLDGNNNGVEERSPADDVFENFSRFFGDANGDHQVDSTDYAAFRSAYRSRRGMSSYRSYFDFNNSGSVDSVDYYQFLRRNNRKLNPDGSVGPLS